MNLQTKTLKEKVAYFAESQRKSLDYGETFYDAFRDDILRAFLKDYNETRDLISTAGTDELECFVGVLSDFIKRYPNEEIIQLCIDRKAHVGEFCNYYFDEEIESARSVLSCK